MRFRVANSLHNTLAPGLGPCIVVFLMILLNQQYEIGSDRLPAPQATALATVMDGIMSDDVPSYRYLAGAGLGVVLAFSGLGGIGVLVGLGFYMPFNIVLTYTTGNLLRIVSDRAWGKKISHEVGIPIAAGLIVGEALVGVGNALIKVFLPAADQNEVALRIGSSCFEYFTAVCL